MAGSQLRHSKADNFYAMELGLRYFPSAWFNLSSYFPYLINVGRDLKAERDINVRGVGDFSFSASLDVLELVHPTMIRVRCPETGGPILALRDAGQFIKWPHLTFTAGLTVPIGADNLGEHYINYQPQYQPGLGVWSPSVGVFYAQGIGPVTPGLGATYVFSGGVNSIGYQKPEALALSLSANWLFWARRLARCFAAVNTTVPLAQGKLGDKVLEGSDLTMISLDIGTVWWVGSVWQKTRKINAGIKGSIPLREGTKDTEPKLGYSVGLFVTLGL